MDIELDPSDDKDARIAELEKQLEDDTVIGVSFSKKLPWKTQPFSRYIWLRQAMSFSPNSKITCKHLSHSFGFRQSVHFIVGELPKTPEINELTVLL